MENKLEEIGNAFRKECIKQKLPGLACYTQSISTSTHTRGQTMFYPSHITIDEGLNICVGIIFNIAKLLHSKKEDRTEQDILKELLKSIIQKCGQGIIIIQEKPDNG